MDKSFPTFPTRGKGDRQVIYALMSMEQPKYAPVLQQTKYLQDHFDVMMTYSLKKEYESTGIPNLPMTYYPLNIVSMEAIMQAARPFADKIGIEGKGVYLVNLLYYCLDGVIIVSYSAFSLKVMSSLPYSLLTATTRGRLRDRSI